MRMTTCSLFLALDHIIFMCRVSDSWRLAMLWDVPWVTHRWHSHVPSEAKTRPLHWLAGSWVGDACWGSGWRKSQLSACMRILSPHFALRETWCWEDDFQKHVGIVFGKHVTGRWCQDKFCSVRSVHNNHWIAKHPHLVDLLETAI